MREVKNAGVLAMVFFCMVGVMPGEAGEFADDSGKPKRWSLGIAGMFSTSPYKSYDNTILPLPMVSYEGERFFLKGLEAGMYLWKTPKHQISIGAQYFGMSFKPDDTDDMQLKQLDKRSSTLMAKASYTYSLPYGMQVGASVSQDVLGKHKGFIGELSFRAPLLMKNNFMLFSQVGVKWSSQNVNDYYYGVSSKEAARSGLPQYKAKSGLTPVAGIQARYTFNNKWSAMVGAQVEFLSSKVKDSPMVGKSVTTSIMAGIQYSF